MKRGFLLALALVLIASLCIGCNAATSQTGAEPTPDLSTAHLEIVNGDELRTLTWDDVQALPSYEGLGGLMTSVGSISSPTRFKGVPLEDLCSLVGGLTPGHSVVVTARDGYAMTFSYDQIALGDFITYDSSTGAEVPFDGKLWAVVAYENEDQLLSERTDGIFRLVILGPQELVTDGHWWVKWVERIEIQESTDDWDLHLEGVITEDMDRATFESGAAPDCHGQSWTDDEGDVWTGIPLWLLAGRVDDDVQHGDAAFNRTLAAAGYQIEVVAGDGYGATLDVADVIERDDIIVAFELNDQPLAGDAWPLQLVGPDLPGQARVRNIVTIRLLLP